MENENVVTQEPMKKRGRPKRDDSTAIKSPKLKAAKSEKKLVSAEKKTRKAGRKKIEKITNFKPEKVEKAGKIDIVRLSKIFFTLDSSSKQLIKTADIEVIKNIIANL
jgi:hypothetical protein